MHSIDSVAHAITHYSVSTMTPSVRPKTHQNAPRNFLPRIHIQRDCSARCAVAGAVGIWRLNGNNLSTSMDGWFRSSFQFIGVVHLFDMDDMFGLGGRPFSLYGCL